MKQTTTKKTYWFILMALVIPLAIDLFALPIHFPALRLPGMVKKAVSNLDWKTPAEEKVYADVSFTTCFPASNGYPNGLPNGLDTVYCRGEIGQLLPDTACDGVNKITGRWYLVLGNTLPNPFVPYPNAQMRSVYRIDTDTAGGANANSSDSLYTYVYIPNSNGTSYQVYVHTVRIKPSTSCSATAPAMPSTSEWAGAAAYNPGTANGQGGNQSESALSDATLTVDSCSGGGWLELPRLTRYGSWYRESGSDQFFDDSTNTDLRVAYYDRIGRVQSPNHWSLPAVSHENLLQKVSLKNLTFSSGSAQIVLYYVNESHNNTVSTDGYVRKLVVTVNATGNCTVPDHSEMNYGVESELGADQTFIYCANTSFLLPASASNATVGGIGPSGRWYRDLSGNGLTFDDSTNATAADGANIRTICRPVGIDTFYFVPSGHTNMSTKRVIGIAIPPQPSFRRSWVNKPDQVGTLTTLPNVVATSAPLDQASLSTRFWEVDGGCQEESGPSNGWPGSSTFATLRRNDVAPDYSGPNAKTYDVWEGTAFPLADSSDVHYDPTDPSSDVLNYPYRDTTYVGRWFHNNVPVPLVETGANTVTDILYHYRASSFVIDVMRGSTATEVSIDSVRFRDNTNPAKTQSCWRPLSVMFRIQPATPSFNNIQQTYCQGETPQTLPAVSLNGISGTWSPATINTSSVGATTYTFTPSVGSLPYTVTIVVTLKTTPVFFDTTICVGAGAYLLPTRSKDGITGTWRLNGVPVTTASTSTTGSITYTFVPNSNTVSPSNPVCANNANFTVHTIQSISTGCPTNVNITLDPSTCTKTLSFPMLQMDGCAPNTHRIVVQDDQPQNGAVIDGPGTWPYRILTVADSQLICWGTINAEDKSGPVLNFYYLPCTHQASSSYPAFQTATFMSTDINLILNQESSWNDTSYTYFSGAPVFQEPCNGCNVTLSASDQITYVSCNDADWILNRVFARINRTFFGRDCRGNQVTIQQTILFKTPSMAGINASLNSWFQNRIVILNGSACLLTPTEMITQFKAGTYPSISNGANQPKPVFNDPFHCEPATETYSIFQEAVTAGVAKKMLSQRMSYSVGLVSQDPVCDSGRRINVNISSTDWCTGTSTVVADNITLLLGNSSLPANLIVSSNELSIGSAGGQLTFNVASNTSWFVSEDMYWASLSPTSGNRNGIVTVTVSPNSSTLSRSGVIFVYGSQTSSRTILLTQSGAQTSPLTVNPSSISFTSTGGATLVGLQAVGNWSASSSTSWLSVDQISGNGNASLVINCQANASPSARTAVVTVQAGSQQAFISISQAATSAFLNFAPASLSFQSSGGSGTLALQSNSPWLVNSKPSWLTLNQMSGQNNATLSVNCSVNSSSQTRNGIVSFLCNGTEIKNVPVTQDGSALFLNLQRDSLYFNTAGGRDTIYVESNGNWTISESSTWLSLSTNSGQLSGKVAVFCTANTSAETRRADISVLYAGSGIRTIRVEQAPFAGRLNVSPLQWDVNGPAGSVFLTVESNLSWTASSPDKWISVRPSSGSGAGAVQVTYTQNQDTAIRQGRVIFQANGMAPVTVQIRQGLPVMALLQSDTLYFSRQGGEQEIGFWTSGGWTITPSSSWVDVSQLSGSSGNNRIVVICPPNIGWGRTASLSIRAADGSTRQVVVKQEGNTPYLTVNPNSITFTEKAESVNLAISSNQNWTVSGVPQWASLSQTSGYGDKTIVLNCATNPNAANRVARLKLAAPNLDTISIGIVQSGTKAFLSVSSTFVQGPGEGGTIPLFVQSNTTWRVTELLSWLSVTPTSGSQSDTIFLKLQPRGSSVPRSGTVTIYGPGAPTVKVTVEQLGIKFNSPAQLGSDDGISMDIAPEKPFLAYPNPSSEEISLDFRQAVQEPFTLVLRDLQGRVLASRIYPVGALPGLLERIPLAHLPEGVYTLAFSAKSSRYVEKIVIKR
ncbi:MAG: hypothetical protein RL181_345 [Bacteroidota bacterium]